MADRRMPLVTLPCVRRFAASPQGIEQLVYRPREYGGWVYPFVTGHWYSNGEPAASRLYSLMVVTLLRPPLLRAAGWLTPGEIDWRQFRLVWGAPQYINDNVARRGPAELQEAQMALRGENTIRVAIRYLEGEVSVVLKHQGGMLPAPSAQPVALSLDSDMEDELGFILWLAVRQASTIERKPSELRLTFNDA